MQDILRFSDLPDYAFPRLRTLLRNVDAPGTQVPLHIGEPTHSFPNFIREKILENFSGFNSYPPNDGTPALLSSIATWISKRYNTPELDFEKNIISLNGTREGLFNATIALSPSLKNGRIPAILLPNPFYQCYMVAAKAVGAEPIFVPAINENGFLPDYSCLPKAILERTTICYICSPSNPQGSIASETYWKNLFSMAEDYNFKILADECYSEIYRHKKPTGAIESANKFNLNPERLIIFNSLSKRSNLPGLRSGFAASGEKTITELKKLKAYSGAPCPTPLQFAAEAAWRDEEHVKKNRTQYNEKLKLADKILKNLAGYKSPEAGFFLWLPVDNGEIAATDLWKNFGVKVLPGAYLSNKNHKTFSEESPGERFIRVALVRSIQEIEFGLKSISKYLN
ncbi:MAG: aspartate aminotransferase [Rhodobiaceae bacterium]|nr:aspartate aminotransferase [Rhodobiaceae bacterium]